MSSDRARWLGRPLYLRLRALSRLLIAHPDFTRAVRLIKDCEAMTRATRKCNGGAIYGPTGSGKTSLAEFMSSLWRDRALADRVIRPVIHFCVPETVTRRGLAAALLLELKDPLWNNGGERELTRRAVTLLVQVRCRLLLIDDAQDIPDQRKRQGVRHASAWIRIIADSTHICIVVMGTRQAEDLFLHAPQLRSRLSARTYIGYFTLESDTAAGRWLRLLSEIDERLPLAESSHLASKDFGAPLYYASNGCLRYLMKLLTHAVKQATGEGREHMSIEDFAKSFDAVHGPGASHLNFFRGYPLRPLDKQGEPFDCWDKDTR